MHSVPVVGRAVAFALLLSLLFVSNAVMAQRPAPTSPSPSNVAHFDIYADGDTVHLLVGTGKKGDPNIALWHRRSTDAGATWSQATRVNRDGDRLNAHHPGENPQLIAMGNRVLAAWTALGPNERRGGMIATALSDDGGATWRPGSVPFAGQKGAQTFPKMVASGSIAHMVWLDSRGGSQGLRYARSPDGGSSWADDRPLAPKTCDCCWNSVAAAPDGSVSALYRGHDPRDMMHIGSRDGKAWRNTGSVGGFDWRVQACPHVGGALVQDGVMLHALTWTGREGAWGLYYTNSRDAGNTWSAPRRLGTEDARNADLARSPDGSVIAIWDEPGTGETAIKIARSSDAGVSWQPAERLPAARNATNPRVAATTRGTTTVWMEGAPYAGAILKVNGAPLVTP